MYTTTDTARPGGIRTAFRRSEAWLDQRGKWAWIAAMVLGFILFWPVGLALLAYMIWGKQMFARSCGHRRHHDVTCRGSVVASWKPCSVSGGLCSGTHGNTGSPAAANRAAACGSDRSATWASSPAKSITDFLP